MSNNSKFCVTKMGTDINRETLNKFSIENTIKKWTHKNKNQKPFILAARKEVS